MGVGVKVVSWARVRPQYRRWCTSEIPSRAGEGSGLRDDSESKAGGGAPAPHSAYPSVAPRLFAGAHHQDGRGGGGGAGFVLDGDGESFGFRARGKRRIDYRRTAVRVWLEYSSGDGRALRRDQPEFVGFSGRQNGHVVGDEDQAAAVAEIEGFALGLRRSLQGDQGYALGFGIDDGRD